MTTTFDAPPAARTARVATAPPAPAGAPPRPPESPRRGVGAGVILLPPWRRAPLLPFRQPAVILAVIAAAAILACASSSAALFLSSSSTEALHRMIAADCPDAGYVAVTQEGEVGSWDSQRVAAAMTKNGLAQPYQVLIGQPADPMFHGITNKQIQLFYRDGMFDHITPLARAGGPNARGVWLPRSLAYSLQVRAGGTVKVGSNDVNVVGVYRDLDEEPLRTYWCSYQPLFLNKTIYDVVLRPLVLPTDPELARSLSAPPLPGQTPMASGTYSMVSPVDGQNVTLSDGRKIAERQAAAYAASGIQPPQDLASLHSGPGQMPQFVHRTTLIRDGLRGPVWPIALGGTLLALLLVGAAGSYWADRRIREIRLLSSRGVGPTALAGKAALELALPAFVGTVLGWLLARWLVSSFGPNPRLDPSAPTQAAATAGIALLAGMALLAAVAGLRSRGATERPIGAKRPWVTVVPWELLLLAVAAASYLRLRSSHSVVLTENIAQVNLLVVAFPLLFLVGGASLVVRLLALVLPPLSRAAGRLSPAWYLSLRRLTASRVVSVTLLAAAATPIAMLVYAAGMTATAQYTLDAKAQVVVGSNAAAQSIQPLRRTAAVDRVGTLVSRYLYAKVGGQDMTLLAIDADTFASTAFWDSRFADIPLPELLHRLRAPVGSGALPAAVVEGSDLDDQFTVRLGRTEADVVVVDRPRLFPGRHDASTMIIVDMGRLGKVDRYAGQQNEVWTNGSRESAAAAIRDQGGRIFDTMDRSTVFEAANLVGVSWTFDYLTALAALVGLVAVGGLLLYLETRQRSRVASYAMGRRMGLTRATHLRSLLIELGGLLAAAFAVGVGLGIAAILLVYSRLDLDTYRPPPPLLTLPVAAVIGAAVATAVVVLLASLYAQRSADRADVSEVLRLG